METMEEKLGTILNNPEMMQQIMSLAQSLGNSTQQQQDATLKSDTSGPDPAMIQKLSALAGNNSIDNNQKQLLQALSPYLSKDRVSKLENAMRAARMARLASTFLGSGGLQIFGGR